MTDSSSDSSERPFSSSPDPETNPEWGPQASKQGGMESPVDSSSFAMDLARMWVQEHQKTAMLGAFAAGVFIGALVRE